LRPMPVSERHCGEVRRAFAGGWRFPDLLRRARPDARTAAPESARAPSTVSLPVPQHPTAV
jgi:hypothetical protein